MSILTTTLTSGVNNVKGYVHAFVRVLRKISKTVVISSTISRRPLESPSAEAARKRQKLNAQYRMRNTRMRYSMRSMRPVCAIRRNSRLLPAATRFPDAGEANSLKYLEIHARPIGAAFVFVFSQLNRGL